MFSMIRSAVSLDDTGDPDAIVERIRERTGTVLAHNIRPELRDELTTLAQIPDYRLRWYVDQALRRV